MWSESTRYSFSGGIEYPHFGQRVLSDAFTLSRLIFCLLGIGAANVEDDFNVFAICLPEEGFALLSPVLLLSCLKSHAWRVSTYGFGKREGAL